MVADLATRHDRKYLLAREDLPAVVKHLPCHLAILDIGDRRLLAYESTYFDTRDRSLYRDHVQGRRKRYKARTRAYRDTRDAMFEVKLKGGRGETVKMRMPYDYERRAELTDEGRRFLDLVIADTYGMTVPSLAPALSTSYHRTTLVDIERGARITIDVGLSWSNDAVTWRADDLALIETKDASGPGLVDAMLCSLGIRPLRVSKYCIGVALLDPTTPANPWSRLLRTRFGWTRQPAAAVPTT